MSLTPSQQRVFDFLCFYIEKEGFPPSYSDIASHFNFSSDGTVRTYLEYLEKKGYIQRHGKARGIKILQPLSTSIPIIGSISAGPTKMAFEDALGSIHDMKLLKKKNGRFALKIKGNSMINVGILNDDIAIIQPQANLNNGDIGAILIDNEATLKRIYFDHDQVRLEPENDSYSPLVIDKKSFNVQLIGKYIGLIREI